MFGYYVILQAKLTELEKKMRQRRRRQAVLRGGGRWQWAFERKEDDEMKHDFFRGKMDDNVHGEAAKMRLGRRESKECVRRAKVSSWATTPGVAEEAGVIGQ